MKLDTDAEHRAYHWGQAKAFSRVANILLRVREERKYPGASEALKRMADLMIYRSSSEMQTIKKFARGEGK